MKIKENPKLTLAAMLNGTLMLGNLENVSCKPPNTSK